MSCVCGGPGRVRHLYVLSPLGRVGIGSGLIDAYAGWIGTVGAKVDLGEAADKTGAAANDVRQAFTRLAAVAGTSTCHLAMSEKAVFVNGVWGPYRDVLIPDYWMAEGGQSATGELLRHVIDTHPAQDEAKSSAKSASSNIYEFLNNRLREMLKKQQAPTISYLGKTAKRVRIDMVLGLIVENVWNVS